MREPKRELEEVIRITLGCPPKEAPSLAALKRALSPWTEGFKEPAKPHREGAVDQTPPNLRWGVRAAEKPSTSGGVAPERELRELRDRLQRKVHELEALKTKLAREEKTRKKAEADLGQKQEALAQLRRALEASREKEALLEARMKALEEDHARLQGETELLGATRRRLEDALNLKEQELAALGSRVAELEAALAAQNAELEALRASETSLQALGEGLPHPFPREALLRVLVWDYLGLGGRPEERLLGLIEGYRALLKGEEHPALEATNLPFLKGEPEGIVVLGVEALLQDLASLPLSRWLRTHALALEAFLLKGQALSSPRLKEVEE